MFTCAHFSIILFVHFLKVYFGVLENVENKSLYPHKYSLIFLCIASQFMHRDGFNEGSEQLFLLKNKKKI